MTLRIDIQAHHLILGFGPTGLSILNALHALGVKKISAIDSREKPPHFEIMQQQCDAIHCGDFNSTLLETCDYLWFSPGVARSTPELQATLTRLPSERVGGDIELFARVIQPHDRVFAITGTNGKSTVTTLFGQICKQAKENVWVGGNLGEPALDLWLSAMKTPQMPCIYVLELSSFQLDTTTHLPVEIGAILNIEPDHLDRYENFAAYQAAKLKLFSQSKQWVSNHDDKILSDYVQSDVKNTQNQKHKPAKTCVEFSLMTETNATTHLESLVNWTTTDQAICYQNDVFINFDLIPIGGLHNIANVMAACAMAMLAGINISDIKHAIQAFKALPHRCVLIKTLNGVRYFDDSKATNLPSTLAAISGFNEPKWLILGGVTKDQDFSDLNHILSLPANALSIRKILLIGKDASQILPHIPPQIAHEYVIELKTAITQIKNNARAGDVVLFSPACASFDQFANYHARGEYFCQLINALE